VGRGCVSADSPGRVRAARSPSSAPSACGNTDCDALPSARYRRRTMMPKVHLWHSSAQAWCETLLSFTPQCNASGRHVYLSLAAWLILEILGYDQQLGRDPSVE